MVVCSEHGDEPSGSGVTELIVGSRLQISKSLI
jgi:hypothetical protein